MGMNDGLNAAAEAALTTLEKGTEGEKPQETPAAAPPAETKPAESAAAPPAAGSKEALIADLKARVEKGELKAEDVAFINPKLQSAVGRRDVRLATFEKNAAAVAKAVADKGIELPQGKTGMDLLMEEGGKGFIDLMTRISEQTVAPVRDAVEQAKSDEEIRTAVREAAANFPEVKEHYAEALMAIDAHKDYTAMAKVPGQLGYVLAGVSAGIALDKLRPVHEATLKENATLKQEVATLQKAMKEGKFATTVGKETSRAGATPVTGETKGRSLLDIVTAKHDELYGSN